MKKRDGYRKWAFANRIFRDLSANGGKPSSSAGLTLIELMLVVTIIAIVLTIATPGFVFISSVYQLREATREVATDLHSARLLAVKENRDFRVVFGSKSYQVVRVTDGSVAKSRNLAVDYPEVTLTGSLITFDSRGNSNAQTLTISHPRGAKNITVNPTGRVKIQ